MRTISLYSIAFYILSVSAFSNVGAFERLWFWYAYQLDPDGRVIAPRCAITMQVGANGRCNFVQFMNYIEQGSGSNIDPTKIQNVNTMDVDAATTALSNGQYTGTYDCTHVYQGLGGVEGKTQAKDNVPGLFQKLAFFCQGKIDSASADLKTSLQQVTVGVARGRQESAINAYKAGLAGRTPPINLQLTPTPVFQGSSDNFQGIDTRNTLRTNAGLTRDALLQAIQEEQANDKTNHKQNAKAAGDAAQKVSEVCRE